MIAKPRIAPDGPESSGLTPKQEAAALATARGLSVPAVAKRAGCGERTLKTWRALPAFRERVSELRAEMTTAAVGRLTDGLDFASSTLRKLLAAKSESIRLQAVRTLFEMTVKLRESTELEAEVQALKEQVAAMNTHRGRVSR